MIDRKDWPEDARNAQAAFDEASWDAVEGYRDTGEMVPGMKDGKLYLYTVDEALNGGHGVEDERRVGERGILPDVRARTRISAHDVRRRDVVPSR